MGMGEYSERISKEGLSHHTGGMIDSCKGTFKYVGVAELVSLLSDYILIHECSECGERVFDSVDTFDGRVELIGGE